MPLSIQLFRTEEGREAVRESQKRRFQSPDIVDHVVNLDNHVRELRGKYADLRKEMKETQTEISKLKKKKRKKVENLEEAREIAEEQKYCDELIEKNKNLAEVLKNTIEEEKDTTQKIEEVLSTIGNLVDPTVPLYNNEEHNAVIKTRGVPTLALNDSPDSVQPHHILLKRIGGYNQKRGVKVIGHRGYFLTGIGVKLNMALQRYAMDFLEEKGYYYLQPPFLMNADLMGKTAELADFKETLYNVDGGESFLIATSEQPISAYHADEVIHHKALPIKYAGISSCFRKEAGAHGKETWGVFRVHQFEKVEQFVLCEAEQSKELHEEMLRVSEEFYQSLGLAYRVVAIVSGALNNAAAKKYDLEAWFPSYNEYKELVSCSNCTDYQSRPLNIKIDSDKGFAHLLNGTLCATERTMCCLLENYQCEKGIAVPPVLQPYLKGLEMIPYID